LFRREFAGGCLGPYGISHHPKHSQNTTKSQFCLNHDEPPSIAQRLAEFQTGLATESRVNFPEEINPQMWRKSSLELKMERGRSRRYRLASA
jgi:hypothetical protein